MVAEGILNDELLIAFVSEVLISKSIEACERLINQVPNCLVGESFPTSLYVKLMVKLSSSSVKL